jgi:glycosyltransferase involved in cell wall biosynthesis
MKISILIPVYNEALTLPLIVERVLAAPLPEGCEKEVVIIDDGSTDGTTELLARYRNTPLVAVHHSIVNFGKGAALRIGIAKSTGDVILVQDGDLEYDPCDYPSVLEPIVRGRAKVVYGSRFLRMPQPRIGGTREMKFANWIANKLLTMTANVLYNARLTDEATAYKAFAREVLDGIRLHCVRFEFCPEVTAKVRRLGYDIAEVGISYNPRGILEGKKIRWQDGVEALWTLLKYRAAPVASFDRRIASPRARTSSAGA